MSRLRNTAAFAVLLAGISAAGFYAARLESGVADSEPDVLSIPAESLDLGLLWAVREFRAGLPVTNNSSDTIQVSAIRVGCKCTSVSPTSFTLPPGKSQQIFLSLDLERGGQTGERPFEVELIPKLEGYALPPVKWTVRAKVREPVNGIPDFVHLKLLDTSQAASRTWSIETPKADVDISVERLSGPFQVSLRMNEAASREPVEGIRQGDLQLDIEPDLGRGLHSGKFVIRAENAGSSGRSWEVPVGIEVVSELVVRPKALALGNVVVGEECRAELEFEMLSGEPLTFGSVDTSEDPQSRLVAEVERELKKGDSGRYRCILTIRPLKTGSQLVPLELTLHGVDESETVIVYVQYVATTRDGETLKLQNQY